MEFLGVGSIDLALASTAGVDGAMGGGAASSRGRASLRATLAPAMFARSAWFVAPQPVEVRPPQGADNRSEGSHSACLSAAKKRELPKGV